MRVQTLAAVLASFAITAVVDAQQTITLPFAVSCDQQVLRPENVPLADANGI